ncbi:MAG TPA: hypothetical protein EYG80_03950 [Flavobacteriaceae bacterium]|nr:hypothetical protein [Flavobacteriaceae bacterium]
MNNQKKIITLGLIGILTYAYFSIITTMEELVLKPSVDLYANELDFQILVFVVTKGIWLLLGMSIIFLILDNFRKGKANENK